MEKLNIEIISNETKIYSSLTQDELNDILLPEQAKQNPQYKNIKERLIDSNRRDLVTKGEKMLKYKIWKYQFKTKSKILKWLINKVVTFVE